MMTRPLLLYRATCAKCRFISLAMVCLSLGWLRRIPLSSPLASALYRRHRVRPGKVALVGYRRMLVGWRVLPGLVDLAALAILAALHRHARRHTGRRIPPAAHP
jgi:hypothetical protein